MIKINKEYSEYILNSYSAVMLKRIKRKYKKNKPKNVGVKKIFEDENGNFSDSKVVKLLIDKNLVNCAKKYEDIEKDEIEKIISYSSINHSSKESEKYFGKNSIKYRLLEDLGVTVCPYCNRQYINCYSDKVTKRVTADIDHFKPKSIYPQLALSLYNFVPSCSICNSRLKKDDEANILYPYSEGFDDDCYFSLKLKSGKKSKPRELLNLLRGYDNGCAKLELNIKNKCSKEKQEKIKTNKKIFNLEAIYQIHTKKALELNLIKSTFEDSSYKKQIKQIFKDLSEDEFFELLYGIRKNSNCLDTPLSKLTKDIVYNDKMNL